MDQWVERLGARTQGFVVLGLSKLLANPIGCFSLLSRFLTLCLDYSIIC